MQPGPEGCIRPRRDDVEGVDTPDIRVGENLEADGDVEPGGITEGAFATPEVSSPDSGAHAPP